MDKPSMFEQARSLATGAKIILDSDGIQDGSRNLKPSSPVILCSALSIEISLKLLIAQEGPVAQTGHCLDVLYGALPELTKNAFELYARNDHGQEFVNSIESQLQAHGNIFVSWRYAYERGNELVCSPSFLYSLAFSLSTFIEHNYKFERNDNAWMVVQG